MNLYYHQFQSYKEKLANFEHGFDSRVSEGEHQVKKMCVPLKNSVSNRDERYPWFNGSARHSGQYNIIGHLPWLISTGFFIICYRIYQFQRNPPKNRLF